MLDKQGSGGTEYPFYNGQGDVFQSLTQSGSYILSDDISDDFGQHFVAASGTDDLSYKWRASSGYRWDGDGLWAGNHMEPIVEVGARYYIPAMGVFITRDKDLGQRPYEYCNADPVNNVDPSGHAPGDGLLNSGVHNPNSGREGDPGGQYGEPGSNSPAAAEAAADQLNQDVSTTQSADGLMGLNDVTYSPSGCPVLLAMNSFHVLLDALGLVAGAVAGSRGGLGGAFFGGIIGLGLTEVSYQLITYGNLDYIFDDRP